MAARRAARSPRYCCSSCSWHRRPPPLTITSSTSTAKWIFGALRTFAFGTTAIGINRPEIRNPLIIEQTTAAIRSALLARGLTEDAADADVTVGWTLGGQGFAVNPWGRAIPTDRRRDNWRDVETPGGGQAESFIEGLLVLDVTQRSTGLLVWRGVYRDTEKDAARLARNLPGDARKLLSRYPSRKR